MMVTMLLRDLSWLVTLADHGHVTDTAAVLRTNQPTLSRTLARVEAELGAQLFDRSASGVRPTPAGELAVEAAREITARYEQLGVELRALLDPEAGVVRLAFLDSIATSLVPQVLRVFHEQAPRVQVVLRQAGVREIVADLTRGAADLAITSARPEGPFHWQPIQDERLVVVVSPSHRLRRRRRIALEELAGEQFVSVPPGYGFRALVDRLLGSAGVVPTISFESQDLATIEGLVAAGLGVAVVPEAVAGQSGTIGIRISTDAARRTIGLTWRSDRSLTPPAERFRQFLVARSFAELSR